MTDWQRRSGTARRRSVAAVGTLAAALAAGGCGESVDCESPGQACTWLGIPGDEGFNGDGHHRLDTRLYWSFDMIFAEDGTPYFIDWNNHQVRKVLPDDTVETVVGWTDPVFPGDGVASNAEYSDQGAVGTEVQLNHPTDLAIAPNGDVLLMAWHNHKLRRIDPDTGRVWIMGGAGAGYAGDGGPLADAIFKQPDALEVGPDGEMYIADQQNQRVRLVDTEGVIDTIVGTGEQGYGGDGGPGLEASLNWEVGSNPEPSGGLALDGSKLYIADTLNHRIRVYDIETQIIETFAGTGEPGYGGDEGPATEAQLRKPHDIEIGPDGHVYFADTDNGAIRAVDPDTGTIRTVVGTGELGLGPEGLPATETLLRRPFGLTFGPEEHLYVHDTINSRILRVAR